MGAALVAGFAVLGAVACSEADAEERLTDVVTALEARIAEVRSSVSLAQAPGLKILITKLATPAPDWHETRPLRTSNFAKRLRKLVFHAVYRESAQALAGLSDVNSATLGGVFDEGEAEYLQRLGERAGLVVTYHETYGEHRPPIPDDVRLIRQRRDLATALDSGRMEEARATLPGFARLCREEA